MLKNLEPVFLANIIKAIVPKQYTFKEAFLLLHMAIPYVIALIIAGFDIFVYKIDVQDLNEEENMLKENKSEQLKLAQDIVREQNKFLVYLDKCQEYTNDIGLKIYQWNLVIFKKIKVISSMEENIEKAESKWTAKGAFKLLITIILLLGALS